MARVLRRAFRGATTRMAVFAAVFVAAVAAVHFGLTRVEVDPETVHLSSPVTTATSAPLPRTNATRPKPTTTTKRPATTTSASATTTSTTGTTTSSTTPDEPTSRAPEPRQGIAGPKEEALVSPSEPIDQAPPVEPPTPPVVTPPSSPAVTPPSSPAVAPPSTPSEGRSSVSAARQARTTAEQTAARIKSEEGFFSFHYRDPMTQGRNAKFTVRIGDKSVRPQLSEGLPDQGGSIQGRTAITPLMSVKLQGDNFTVEPRGYIVQPISPSAYTEWSWWVVSHRRGNHRMKLTISTIANNDLGFGTKHVVDKFIDIPVRVDPLFVVRRIAVTDGVQLLPSVSVVGGFTGAFRWWRRRKPTDRPTPAAPAAPAM